jgi:hypothetical protein
MGMTLEMSTFVSICLLVSMFWFPDGRAFSAMASFMAGLHRHMYMCCQSFNYVI